MLGQKILLTISNLRIALFGATNVVKNSDKEKYVYNASGITFDWEVHGGLVMTLLETL